MERLDIMAAPVRPDIEASIHFARYAIAKELVKGKKVLDVACGEGYGSYLLAQAGAQHVVGVDISAESIQRAKNIFAAHELEFIAADVSTLDSILTAEQFDVIISIETIEHLANPKSFLKSIKRLVKPTGTIVVSCPNDHWYFPEDNQRNPYHLRKYHFEEFQALTLSELGDNVQWSLGTSTFGFCSTPLSRKNYNHLPQSWMAYIDTVGSYLVSGDSKLSVSPSNCSFFVGIWNASKTTAGLAAFPISMDEYAMMAQSQETAQSHVNVLKALQAEKENVNQLHREQRRLGLRLHAEIAENTLLRDELRATRQTQQFAQVDLQCIKDKLQLLEAENRLFRIGYERYIKLSRLVPKPIRSFFKKVVGHIRCRDTI